MEFPVRCMTCTRVIGNKYEPYKKWLSFTFKQADEYSTRNKTLRQAFIRNVIEPRLCEKEQIFQKEWNVSKEYRKHIALVPLSEYEILGILGVKQYCCKMNFITYGEIEFPEPDYLEKTFSRVKFINKKRKTANGDTIEERNKYIKEQALVAR